MVQVSELFKNTKERFFILNGIQQRDY